MWDDLKSLFSSLADFLMVIALKFWAAVKWLGLILAKVAVWLWKILVVAFLVSADLVLNHYLALLATVPILFIGFLITNKLQKKKFFISIPWYQNPKTQPLLLIPLILAILGLLVCGGPISISKLPTTELIDKVGPSGHLGVPETIWAALIGVILSWVAGIVALKQQEKTPRVIKSAKEKEEGEKTPPVVKRGNEKVEEETPDVIRNDKEGGGGEKIKRKGIGSAYAGDPSNIMDLR